MLCNIQSMLLNNSYFIVFSMINKHYNQSTFSYNSGQISEESLSRFLLRELLCSPSIFPFFSSWFGVHVLAKGSPGKDLSSRHSNAARVSENIRLQRRAVIFAASVIDAIF